MITQSKLLAVGPNDFLVVSFDLEWVKNYRIKDGNRPFCFSFVYCLLPKNIFLVDEQFEFGFHSYYIEHEDEIPALVKIANQICGDFLSLGNFAVVGHQLSSDIAVLINYLKQERLEHIVLLKQMWKTRDRKGIPGKGRVFDTRYDMASMLTGKSRRLVDVCDEFGLEVSQPELGSFSMTQMHRCFLENRDYSIAQKLSVLNIRHSLSAALLYILFFQGMKPERAICVNKMLYKNLHPYFEYVNGDGFAMLLK